VIANRTARVLLKTPGYLDRWFTRCSPAATAELFDCMSPASGEMLQLQRYDPYISPKHPGLGWVTTKAKKL
jgi:hypothetical protein